MFNNKAKGTLMSADNTTLIAKGTEISGEIKFSGCLEIEGTVLGNIIAEPSCEKSQVRIQNSGQVKGDVCAPVIIINGQIEGNVYSSKRVELATKALVCGDVHYQMMEMVKGAQINGGLMYTEDSTQKRLEPSDPTGQAVDSDDILGQYVDSGLNG